MDLLHSELVSAGFPLWTPPLSDVTEKWLPEPRTQPKGDVVLLGVVVQVRADYGSGMPHFTTRD